MRPVLEAVLSSVKPPAVKADGRAPAATARPQHQAVASHMVQITRATENILRLNKNNVRTIHLST
jgi:hypothetical protein